MGQAGAFGLALNEGGPPSDFPCWRFGRSLYSRSFFGWIGVEFCAHGKVESECLGRCSHYFIDCV